MALRILTPFLESRESEPFKLQPHPLRGALADSRRNTPVSKRHGFLVLVLDLNEV